MTRDWESTFSSWTEPASNGEQERYERTRDAIRAALARNSRLSGYSFTVYPKGSYPNYTNVVRDSDVDIAAELTEFRQNDFNYEAEGLTVQDVGLAPYTGGYSLSSFKDDVEAALVDIFGRAAVDRGSKAIHIRETSQSLKADVVPCVTHREYHSRTSWNEGIRLLNDDKPFDRIINYPKQHLDRGVTKNDLTNRRYKRVVRILKRLENEMKDQGVIKAMPSFMIESAVWNVPAGSFTRPATWTGRVRNALAHIFNETLNDGCVRSDDWLEANGIKYLFHSSQGWSFRDAHQFAGEAWDYVGYE